MFNGPKSNLIFLNADESGISIFLIFERSVLSSLSFLCSHFKNKKVVDK